MPGRYISRSSRSVDGDSMEERRLGCTFREENLYELCKFSSRFMYVFSQDCLNKFYIENGDDGAFGYPYGQPSDRECIHLRNRAVPSILQGTSALAVGNRGKQKRKSDPQNCGSKVGACVLQHPRPPRLISPICAPPLFATTK